MRPEHIRRAEPPTDTGLLNLPSPSCLERTVMHSVKGHGRSWRIRCVVALLCAAAVGACGEDMDEPSSALRAALLTSGPVSDAGWYAGAYDGLLLIEDSMDASVSHQQTATPAEYDEAFIAYASAGYDIIFAHGNEYQDAAIRAGEQFPDVRPWFNSMSFCAGHD